MERGQQKQILEALIVSAVEPVSAARLAEIVPGLEASEVAGLVAEIGRDYEAEGHPLEIWEVAGGYQLRTHASLAPYLRLLHRERALRLTRAALETLSVIAYKQPVTRAEVEHVRGVDAGPVLKSLVDRKLCGARATAKCRADRSSTPPPNASSRCSASRSSMTSRRCGRSRSCLPF